MNQSIPVYVIGFAFTEDLRGVVLVKKNHPDFFKDKWTGIGGRPNGPSECLLHAMRREFLEETGIQLSAWLRVCTVHFDDRTLVCYAARLTGVHALPPTNDVGEELMFADYRTKLAVTEDTPWLMEMAKARIACTMYASSDWPLTIYTNEMTPVNL